MIKLQRTNGPILTKDDAPGYGAVFNAGSISIGGKFYVFARGAKLGYIKKWKTVDRFLRASYENYYSDILLFGGELERPKFIKVLLPGGPDTEHPYGVEDPRVMMVQGKYLMTFSDLVRPPFTSENSRIGLALLGYRNGDFSIGQKWRVGPPGVDNKNASVVQLEGDRVGLIHRIMPNINVAFFENFDELLRPPMDYWKKYMEAPEKYVILKPGRGERKVGAGPPPIWTEDGWVFFYHAVDRTWRYLVKVALLDSETLKVKNRLSYPLLEPERDYEKHGDVDNVVFPTGAILRGDEVLCTYGAADKAVGAASVKLDALLDALLST